MADVKFRKGYVVSNGENVPTLNKGLSELTICGCGIECDCFGYLVLPNWNSTTGERTEGYAIYIVDGAIVVSTKAVAETAIKAYKVLAAA